MVHNPPNTHSVELYFRGEKMAKVMNTLQNVKHMDDTVDVILAVTLSTYVLEFDILREDYSGLTEILPQFIIMIYS